jgi:hypothetical protein
LVTSVAGNSRRAVSTAVLRLPQEDRCEFDLYLTCR